MSVPMPCLLGGCYPRGLIVHQESLRYGPSDRNTKLDIKFSGITFNRYIQSKKIRGSNDLKVPVQYKLSVLSTPFISSIVNYTV